MSPEQISRRIVLKRIAAVSAVAVIVPSAFAIRNVTRAACANSHKRDAMEMQKSNGCREYWLNRYQSAWVGFLGLLATAGAALLAWRAVQKQVFHSNRVHLEQRSQQSRLNASALSARAKRLRQLEAIKPRSDGSPLKQVDRIMQMQNLRYLPLTPLEPAVFGEIAHTYNDFAENLARLQHVGVVGGSPEQDEDAGRTLNETEVLASEIEIESERLSAEARRIDAELAAGSRVYG